MKLFFRLILLIVIISPVTVRATVLAMEQIPEPLKPWIPWVLHDEKDSACPFFYTDDRQKHCSWPARLTLDLRSDGGRFSGVWTLYRESWLQLPGDASHWPLAVTANSKPVAVTEKQGIPATKLPAGIYRINGTFQWERLPESLKVPEETGLMALSLDQQPIPFPALKQGQLWLKTGNATPGGTIDGQNALELHVFRKIIDEVPLQILTHLDLQVSGQQREIHLPDPLPQGFIPLSLQSDLPAKLETDGRLVLQLRPGIWQLEFLSRHGGDTEAVSLNETDLVWPRSEIWVFESRPELRTVEIEQLDAIDAELTNLPATWKKLPAYKFEQGHAMLFKVIRRGDPEPAPNQLRLDRQLWLDFSGGGYTARDKVTGTVNRDWRLNALPETHLGRVTLDGENQLITKLADVYGEGKQGVEIRMGQLNLEADSRIDATTLLSATGWEQNFQSVQTQLNLPPGWKVFAVSGVDNLPDTWIARWSLLDLFMVLIAAMAVGRLWSPLWGGFTLATLSLIWHEPESPHFVWLGILAATALAKVLPHNAFRLAVISVRNLCLLILCLAAVPFMVNQLRIAFYPQLELDIPTARLNGVRVAAAKISEVPEPVAAMALPTSPLASKSIALPLSAKPETDETANPANFNFQESKAMIQTGPGVPEWQWRKILLSWNGLVDSQQRVRLWLLPPLVTSLLNFLQVAMLAVLALLLSGLKLKLPFPGKAANVFLCTLLLPLLFSLASPNCYADFPPQELLESLKKRLLESPDCLPVCAAMPQMQIELNEQKLAIAIQVHAQQATAVPLPADTEQWIPNEVSVDGEPAAALLRNGRELWLSLNAGVHQVDLSGFVPPLNKFTLPLPLKPGHITVECREWQVKGIKENGLSDLQLQFSKKPNVSAAEPNEATKIVVQLPPFVKVERTLSLGLDWRVTTQVVRFSPADAAVVLSIPLLTGESVTTSGIRVEGNRVTVNLIPGQSVFRWQSRLEQKDIISLQAEQTQDWTEVWRAEIGSLWHLKTSGIPMIRGDHGTLWRPEWHPWPGERLDLELSRPQGISGQNLTIDNSRLSVKLGKRNREAQLTVNLRSSQGGQHNFILPERAVLQSVEINGRNQTLRQEGEKITFPVTPGHQEIRLLWLQDDGISTVSRTPAVNLNMASVNSHLQMQLGEDRWVLLAWGPRFGPAVLFWGLFAVIILLAAGLGKVTLTPLKFRQWFLLLLGLSQIPVPAAAEVIGWLLLLGWRRQTPLTVPRLFNTLQIALAALTLLSIALMFSAVTHGLLDSPEMQISGNGSTAYNLNWYQDRNDSALPVATAISVPITVYRLAMLAWSMWLAISLLDWLAWGWKCFSAQNLWLATKTNGKNKNLNRPQQPSP